MKPEILQMRRRPFNADVLRRQVRRFFNYGRRATGYGRIRIDGRQFRDASLDPLEIAGGRLRRSRTFRHAGHSIFGLTGAIGSISPIIWMIIEECPQLRRLDAFPATERLEERRHFARIVSGAHQDLRAERDGFGFRFAAVFQKNDIESGAADGGDDVRRVSAGEAAHGAKSGLRQISFRRLTRSVPERDVSDLMRERSGQFAFTARGRNRPASDINRSAGKRERVHIGNIGDFEAIRVTLARRARDQSLAEAVDIFIYAGVGEYWQALLDRDRRSLANVYFLLRS